MAEGEGFEPSIRFPVYTLSKRAPSAARPPLLAALAEARLRALARSRQVMPTRAGFFKPPSRRHALLYSANNLHKPVYLMEVDQFRNMRN